MDCEWNIYENLMGIGIIHGVFMGYNHWLVIMMYIYITIWGYHAESSLDWRTPPKLSYNRFGAESFKPSTTPNSLPFSCDTQGKADKKTWKDGAKRESHGFFIETKSAVGRVEYVLDYVSKFKHSNGCRLLHSIRDIPSGKLTVCYWKWPI
jgi:hypothetical protein